jgi:hypothetical protein
MMFVGPLQNQLDAQARRRQMVAAASMFRKQSRERRPLPEAPQPTS